MKKIRSYLLLICFNIMVVFIPNTSATLHIYEDLTLTEDLYDRIVIEEDNVTLDLGGHSVVGLSFETAITANRKKGITIKNGIVQNFYAGVSLSNCGYHCNVEKIIAINCNYGFQFYNCMGGKDYREYIEVQFCKAIRSKSAGFYFSNCEKISFNECYAFKNKGNGFSIFYCQDVWLVNSKAFYNEYSGAMFSDSRSVAVHECDFSYNTYYGLCFDNTTGKGVTASAHTCELNSNYIGLYIKNKSNYHHFIQCSGVKNRRENLRDECAKNKYYLCNFP